MWNPKLCLMSKINKKETLLECAEMTKEPTAVENFTNQTPVPMTYETRK